MAAPQYLTSWKPSCIVAAHNALLPLIVAGTGVPRITIHNSSDTLLAECPLIDTAGSVNQTSGLLTLTPDGREESAPAGGTPSYASIRDASGNELRSIPCKQGTTADPGWCVLSSMTIIQGEPVEIVSASIL